VENLDAEILGQIETHRGELDRYVRVEPPLANPVEHVQVLTPPGPRFGLGVNALAEEIERGRDPFGVERDDRVEHLLQRLAGDESLGELAGQRVVTNELEYLRLIRQIQQRATQHDRVRGRVV